MRPSENWGEYLLRLGYWLALAVLGWICGETFPTKWTGWLAGMVLGLGGGWMLWFERRALPGEGSLVLQRGLGLLMLAGASWLLLPDQGAGRLAWQTCTAEALAEAKREHRPVLVFFAVEGSSICGRLEQKVFASPIVNEAAQGYVTLKVDLTYPNAPLAKEAADRFQVTNAPTVVFLDGEGREQVDRRMVGYERARLFVKRLGGEKPQ